VLPLTLGMRAIARAYLAGIDLQVEGVERVPATGPAMLVCRHYHHLYDGAALVRSIARPVRIVVGLDWAKDARQRATMERLCRLAGWPVVLRDPGRGNAWGQGYHPEERLAYTRAALLRSVELLRRGELLAIFPEGYPRVDPQGNATGDEWPPFAGGHISIALRALRLGLDVPLIPAGFAYAGPPEKPASIVLRFGAPQYLRSPRAREDVERSLQSTVRALSQ